MMESQSPINDGGPAFPRTGSKTIEGYGVDEQEGMSLRDYFAIHADLSKDIEHDGCIGERMALNLMDGIPAPDWEDHYLAARVWWAEAESRLRYMKADAMLKARSAS